MPLRLEHREREPGRRIKLLFSFVVFYFPERALNSQIAGAVSHLEFGNKMKHFCFLNQITFR